MAYLRSRFVNRVRHNLIRRWLVAFGHKGIVEVAFGRFGFRGGVRAGVSAFGHHHAALTGRFYGRRFHRTTASG